MYAEYVVDNIADIPDFNYIHDLHGSVAVGLMYRFGPTTKDAERIANEKKFNQEELDALYNKVNQLNGELNDAQQEEIVVGSIGQAEEAGKTELCKTCFKRDQKEKEAVANDALETPAVEE